MTATYLVQAGSLDGRRHAWVRRRRDMDRSLRQYRRRTLNALVAGMLIVGYVGASAVLLVRWNMRSPPPPIIGRNCGLVTHRVGLDPLAGSDPHEAESRLWHAHTTVQTPTV